MPGRRCRVDLAGECSSVVGQARSREKEQIDVIPEVGGLLVIKADDLGLPFSFTTEQWITGNRYVLGTVWNLRWIGRMNRSR